MVKTFRHAGRFFASRLKVGSSWSRRATGVHRHPPWKIASHADGKGVAGGTGTIDFDTLQIDLYKNMKVKSIDSLYDLLENRDFLNPHTADIFSPFFFYTYDASKEYQVRKEIDLLKEKLQFGIGM